MNYSERLNRVIPGGCHTYSRGDDQFPANAPQILTRGKGCKVWDPAGNSYIDYGMGLRSVTVGYANKRINDAAISAILDGNNLTRASTIELKAAEKLVSIIDNIEMVKFAKNGSNVTTAAVKLARAYTGKKYVMRCQDHPFFSFDDWFVGNTSLKRGIPLEISKLTLGFNFNSVESVEKIVNDEIYKNKIAAIILEPSTAQQPALTQHGNFLQYLRHICDENNIVLIFDEIVTGFRIYNYSCQKTYNVQPDLLTFGKAMANGFSVAALCGKRKIMKLGGIKDKGIERTFLLSSTYGAEMSSLAAFIETVKVYEEENVHCHLTDYGTRLIAGANKISKDLGILDYFYFEGFPQSPCYVSKNKKGESCYKMRTLFNQEMIKHNIIMPWVAISYAHKTEHLEKTLLALKSSLSVYKEGLLNADKYLINNDIQMPVFRKFN